MTELFPCYHATCHLAMRVWETIRCLSFFEDFIYLFLERWEGREKVGERIIDVCERYIDLLPLTSPNWGPGLQPRHVL